MISLSQCPACGATHWKEYLQCKDHTVSQETFSLKECSNCHLVVTDPRPENDRLGDYYLSGDYISHNDKPTSITDRIYVVARSFALKRKIKLIEQFHNSKNKTLLDYGCGTGHFLKASQNAGWSITGVEPSAIAREAAIRNTGATISSSIDTLSQHRFTTITLWHVLEHIPELNQALTKFHELLAENGTLFIAVPNHSSDDGQRYQALWAGYDVPRHLWHFTPQNMKTLIEKHGFQLKQILPMKLDAFYVSMLSEKYKNNQKLGLIQMINAFFAGWRSNARARRNGAYSSLIYILTK